MNRNDEQLWTIKGATLSDKTARKEYKLTQEEILEGINEGKLHFRINYIRIENKPAQAYIFQPQDSHMIIVWAQKNSSGE